MMSAFTTFRALAEGLSEDEVEKLVLALTLEEARAADGEWPGWAHEGQSEPKGDWRTWAIMAGRGFGKTRAGSEWIVSLLGDSLSGCPRPASEKGQPGDSLSGCPHSGAVMGQSNRLSRPLRIALVGATLAEARRVMVEGKSGLLEVAGPWIREWRPSLGILRFRTGAEAALFSGASPELLRGPEHDFAWCDELAKWEKPGETWDMLQLGLRLGERPRVLVTTTPRPGPVLRRIMASPGCVVTGGPTRANPHLPRAFVDNVHHLYAGTRLARQELEGELLADTPGALWSEELLERCRLENGDSDQFPASGGVTAGAGTEIGNCPHFPFTRLVVAVDPPAGDGTCGIVACAKDEAGTAHLLADHSVTGRSPEGWARAVADAAAMWGHLGGHSYASVPIRVVAESNQGGLMVQAVLRIADPGLRVKLVTATQGKSDRAAPVAMLFEAGKVVLHGRFPELEAELCGLIAGGDYQGPGSSPDRADAMVWALTELMLQKEARMPRIRSL
jgi:phage terminase large subunit-like protein